MSKQKATPKPTRTPHDVLRDVAFTFIYRAISFLEEMDKPHAYSDAVFLALSLSLLYATDELKELIKSGLNISVAITEYEQRFAPTQQRGLRLLKELAETNFLYT